MARKNRLFIQGMPHLAQLRGHNGEALFRTVEDYSAFERYLTHAARRYEISIHSWSLAAQRVLLMVSAPERQALSRFIQHIGRSYVPYYNLRYQRRGALWGSRYLCSPLEADAYFLAVKRFIECGEDGVQGQHSDGGMPTEIITPHSVWLRLGMDESQRQVRFQDFCRTPFNRALVTRICRALEQNCLLATPVLSQQLEERLERQLRSRHCGRPRKNESSPVEQWVWLEKQAEQFLRQHGYQQIRLSLLEREPLFAPGGPSVPGRAELRGDGTTGCLRLVADNLHVSAMSRVWYVGAMFHQHSDDSHVQQNHQVGVEAFGMPGVDIELEHLVMQSLFLRRLGLGKQVELHLNMLGDETALNAFRQALRGYYQPLSHLLDPEQRSWLECHPEWLIHYDDILLQRVAAGAPRLEDFISADSRDRFLRLQKALNRAGVAWQHDPMLYPGNDYCHLVFEWRLGNGTVISRGGRYDACASRVVKRPLFACGFAFMLEPIITLLSHLQQRSKARAPVDIVIIPGQSRVAAQALLLGRRLRHQFPRLSIVNECSRLRMSTRYKNSYRQGARFILELEGDGRSLLLYNSGTRESQPSSLDTVTSYLGKAMML